MSADRPASGATRRALRVAAMSAGVAGSYVGYLLQRAFVGEERRERTLKAAHGRAARRMRQEMEELRGPIMKLGQALSLQGDALPPEMLEELSKLQMQAPGMHAALVRAQVRGSLGADPDDLFRTFDPEPFAAASLGPFDFGDATFLADYGREAAALARAKGTVREYIFMARAEIGLYQTLHRLRARVATTPIVRRYLDAKPRRA